MSNGSIRMAPPFGQIDGVRVTDGFWYKYDPRLVDDGTGGVIVAWYDYRSGDHFDVYAQRFDSDGNRHGARMA